MWHATPASVTDSWPPCFSSMSAPHTDYINQEKIQRIKHLIITENISLEAAGEAFGFPNVKYLSTLFHKYTGMTVRDCKKLSKK